MRFSEVKGVVARAVRPSPGVQSIVVGLFEHEAAARQALEALRTRGVQEEQLRVVDDVRNAAADGSDLSDVLASLGVADGEARFYAAEARSGRSLVAVDARGDADAVRALILEHGGYDVRSRGRELARPSGAGVRGGTGPRPVDVTGRWEDVRSRYEMLWQQHYGTTDATFEQLEPAYQFAWQAANDAHLRGRPWSEVESMLRHDWQSASDGAAAGRLARAGVRPASGDRGRLAWEDVEGPIRDVWEDVAAEAAMGAEGGADRRIPSQGTDQTVAARDVRTPTQGAA